MKLERHGASSFELTVSATELAALIGAARMAFEAVAADPQAPPEASRLLERLLRDYEASLARATDGASA